MALPLGRMSASEIQKGFTEDSIKAMARAGWFAASEAYRQTRFPNNWENRTYNLHDSYGSAVYVNGDLREDTIHYAVERGRSNKDSTRKTHYGRNGREALDIYFKKNHFGKKSGEIVVVVVAAMWYAEALEKKGYYVIKGVAYRELAKHIETEMAPVFEKWGMSHKDMSRVIGRGRYWKNIDKEASK